MSDRYLLEINFELKQLEKLLLSYEGLITKSALTPPDVIEIAALSTVLHSFYCGIENILVIIAKNIDNSMPHGEQWHKKLLKQLSIDTPNRNKVISADMLKNLSEYLAFRHFFRHSYTFFMDWKEMKGLVADLSKVLNEFEDEINKYFLKGDLKKT